VGRFLTRRPAAIALVAAGAVACAAAWVWLAGAAATHPHGTSASMRDLLSAVALWQAMLVAMMAPTVAPWILAYGRLVADGPGPGPIGPTVSFAAGYFAIWLAYAVAASVLQLALATAGLLGGDAVSPLVAGGVLLAAGIFQFLPVKQACLTHCRNPLSFLLARWRGGPPHAFALGARHGAYCVGCCWLLMLTGFAVGLMNLAWMAVLTVVMAVEQTVPGGPWVGRLFGAGLVLWGLALGWAA
jgi:predicted metal-binding membrane protein